MLTKRKLTDWRRDAIKIKNMKIPLNTELEQREVVITLAQANERILELTQELIDQHLLKESEKE